MTATGLGFAVVQLDVIVVNVALERIGASFGGGVAGLQRVVNAYTIVFASLILSVGALGDRLGAKCSFIGGFWVFVAASMACGVAPNLAILIANGRRSGPGQLTPFASASTTHDRSSSSFKRRLTDPHWRLQSGNAGGKN